MIGLLRGIILSKQPPNLLLDVGGVGYEVQAPMSTFYQLPDIGSTATLLTQFIIRENSQALYGFHTEYERAIFREIIKISGIGPKLAITILSGIEIDALLRCVRDRDVACLVRLPGVGKKTADRLLVELQDKLAGYLLHTGADKLNSIAMTTQACLAASKSDQVNMNLNNAAVHNPVQDAISALIALGYKEQEAKRALLKLPTQDPTSQTMHSEELIRMALQNMSKI